MKLKSEQIFRYAYIIAIVAFLVGAFFCYRFVDKNLVQVVFFDPAKFANQGVKQNAIDTKRFDTVIKKIDSRRADHETEAINIFD